jgi:hypothetical protein
MQKNILPLHFKQEHNYLPLHFIYIINHSSVNLNIRYCILKLDRFAKQ